MEKNAVTQVVSENALETAVRESKKSAQSFVDANADWKREKESHIHAEARRELVEELGLQGEAVSYLKRRLRNMHALLYARREVIAEAGRAVDLDNPRFRYEATGPYKRYNLLYTPSRVDLGAQEVHSVKNVPKWVGGVDVNAANSGRSFYGLYNMAGVTAVDSPRLAEFLKVGENFFSRGGVFYLSLTAGVNIDVLGIGDFEFFRDQWNMRGDRMVLPTGETYGGFCVPKEFSLLYAIIVAALRPTTASDIYDSFGIPKEIRADLTKDLRAALRLWTECGSILEWEQKARAFLEPRIEKYVTATEGKGFLARIPRLASIFEQLGVMGREGDEEREIQYAFTDWVNKKAQGLEEINRSGPFRKVHLIQRLLKAARKRNPQVAPEDECIGVIGASYKEGERIADKEIPISDVRFSAGARKLAIYSGMSEKHLLLDLDPDGRELVRRMIRDVKSPADIRFVGRCTGSDLLNYVPASGLEPAKDEIVDVLHEAGLDDNMIRCNCDVYGGDLKRWVGVKDLPDAERNALVEKIGARIHLVVIDRRGPFRTYREALQGSDFVDLGIPDPELLDLIDDLPRFIAFLRRGRPHSALVFADSTSGGRRRAFSYHYASSECKVKELLALEPNAAYGSLGLGDESIEIWRHEMEKDRDEAVALLDALKEEETAKATAIYERIRERMIRHRRAERAAQDEITARQMHCPKHVQHSYHLASQAMSLVKRGLKLGDLDFGTWLVLGGMYAINGKLEAPEMTMRRKQFESLIAKSGAERGNLSGLTGDLVDDVVTSFVRPIYSMPEVSEYREVSTGIEGSLKAAEEQVSRLAARAARRKQAELANRQRRQRRAFLAESPAGDFRTLYDTAAAFLGDGTRKVDPENYGRFLAWTKALVRQVCSELAMTGRDADTRLDGFFGAGMALDDGYLPLVYALAKATEKHREDNEMLMRCAEVLELLDRALLIQRTLGADNPDELMVQIARYFDTTVNGHIFDYIPYHYHKQRSAAFEGFTREQKIELATRRHQWLYRYARMLMLTETRLAETDSAYQDAWIGDASRGVIPLGVRGENDAERFWFSYARLRDASVLVHDGFPLPELLLNVSPDSLLANERPTVGIIYPFGNTTVPVALEQGHRLARNEKINLILSAFPTIEDDTRAGRTVLRVHDGLMYLNASDFERLLHAAGKPEKEIKQRCRLLGDDGIFVAIQLSEPLIADAVFFHFTHPLRPDIGKVGCPLIQPILWEAATHLKCALPDMLKGSGVRTADQFNWYRRERNAVSEEEGLKEVRRRLTEFAENHDIVIVKPEKESGGRRAKILPVRQDHELLTDNIRELTELIYDISQTDNVAVQSVITSRVRQLFRREFLESMVDRFARIGATCHLDREPQTPLFCYFRQIVVRGAQDYQISHHICVISTAGIANVGQGGLLYEYTDNMIHPKYRKDLRDGITYAALESLVSQRNYIREHWREILDEYLDIYPEFQARVPRELGEDLTGIADWDIPYEMGDYMPVMLVDQQDRYVAVYDRKAEKILPLFHEDGSPTEVEIFDKKRRPIPRVDSQGNPLPIPAFDEAGIRIPLFDSRGEALRLLTVFKIEPNPGAGLWRPHNDQLPPERKGEGVYTIFRCLGERARVYRDRLANLMHTKSLYNKAAAKPRFLSASSEVDAVGKAIRRAENELKQ
ncbi:MAG TPA: hypothetical protein PLG59_01885 [bacterium]|nr:hypothetical protein [bacterium]